MELYSVFITGANSGIGLEFAKQFVHSRRPPKVVFATDKNEDTAQELKAIRDSAQPGTKVHILKMDVTVADEIEEARKAVEDVVGDNGLTLLINNAGTLTWMQYPVTREDLLFHFNTNTVGPILVAQAMLPLLKKAASRRPTPGMSFSKAAILNITSAAGSIGSIGNEPKKYAEFRVAKPSYKISKAALNMAMRVLAAVLKKQNDEILVVNISPGWVKTAMGTEKAEIQPQDSISAMMGTISKLNETHSGTFIDRFGKPIVW